MNTHKLKIIFLDFDDIKNPLLAGGQARATVEVGKRLAEKGHVVKVICSKYPGSKDRYENGISYKHIGLATPFIRLNNLIYIFTLPFYVSRVNSDIIVECFTPPISTLFSPLFTKNPVVALPSCFDADHFSKIYHLPFYLVEKLGLKFYKYSLPYSKFINEKFKKLNQGIGTKIVPEGVGDIYFKVKNKKAKHILFLGRFDIKQKGIDLLLEAYAKVQSKIKLPLLIVGNGPDKEKIKGLVKKLGLTNKVKVRGPAYGEEKFDILSHSAFVAFPSRFETFSLFALEALASGLTFVAFNTPGLYWSGNKVVLKSKSYDIDDYAENLIKASNLKLARKLGKAARKFALKFSWDMVADEYESYFYEILRKEHKDHKLQVGMKCSFQSANFRKEAVRI